MVSLDSIYGATGFEYQNIQPINIYDSNECQALATQAIAYRHLTLEIETELGASPSAIPIILVEDQYPGWIQVSDLQYLQKTDEPYKALRIDRAEIEVRLPQVIEYAKHAMAKTNEYLWGGTIGPNLDCSGLVQRSFGSVGIWLPRDAYQQEAFLQVIEVSLYDSSLLDDYLQAGDLVFFGPPEKATHVGIYLGDGRYIHSSGKDKGRNGIGINHLIDMTHPVSQNYAKEFRGAGRVVSSFSPIKNPHY